MKKNVCLNLILSLIVLVGIAVAQQKEKLPKCIVYGKEIAKFQTVFIAEYKKLKYNLCSEQCRQAFLKEPEKYLLTVYTCPMHPEVKAEKPGKCPDCGMFLEGQMIPKNSWEQSKDGKD